MKRESGKKPRDSSRRDFLHAGAASLAVLVGGAAGKAAAIDRSEVGHILDHPEPLVEGGARERMRADLVRALGKPMSQRQWIMVMDLQKCIGCKACTVACVAENNLPPGVAYRPVTQTEVGAFPNVRLQFLPRPCMHCDNPPCTSVCPVGATYKREDGVVAIDYDDCIGCRYCITACPYGARYFDFGEYYQDGTPEVMSYETRPSPEYSEDRVRLVSDHGASPKGNVRKCQFCLHRVEDGALPACLTTCLGGATYFGDYADRESLVRELVGEDRVMRLKEELGTEPSVYYLV
jgi:Fe-S-cluster-containing dehydrogenase component